ncbi:MAG: pentapeptide repeat-containing protein [Cyanobacteria bacterium J06621_12]
MNYKFLTTATIILASVLTTQSGWSQDNKVDAELYEFCARFPSNSKCEGIETPISLESRDGEEFSCSFEFDPGELDQADECKVSFREDGITVYQELGEKLDLIDDERATKEIEIPRDRIFITNYQVWNKIHRWQLGFITEPTESKPVQTNFLVVLMDEEQAETFGLQARSLGANKPELIEPLLAESLNSAPELEQLIETGKCEYCDLSNADLSGVEIEKANLVGANLTGANLTGATMEGAYLLGANLTGADLTDTNLSGANLTFAKLTESTAVNVDFEAANLQSANLEQVNLEGADLTAPAFFQSANLSNANLIDAKLKGANFSRANLQQANLEGADLGRTDVELKNIPGNYSYGEQLIDNNSLLLNVIGVTSKGVDFYTDFLGANLEGANLSYTSLDKVNFERTNLTNVNLSESELEEENLESAKVCGVTMPDGSSNDRDCQK